MNPQHKLQVSDSHHLVTILELINKNNSSHLSIYSEIGDNIFGFEQSIDRLAAAECEMVKLIVNTGMLAYIVNMGKLLCLPCSPS